ncbi:MAG TPA: hypothetical protein VGX22_14190 [Candidatus Dormibacteraeota bacterium]|nr:hypothetical protein [Candidatus Dormibacteraeota bacterium]
MRRGQVSAYVMTGMAFLAGFAGIWVGVRQASSVQPFPLLVGIVFLGCGIWLLSLQLSRSQPAAGAAAAADNYVAERTLLAQTARDFYVNKLLGRKSPNEFDQQMLQLFDAIEVGVPDIHDRIEAVRAYTRRKGLFASWNDRFKASVVWQHGAAYLRWRRADTAENWHLYTNWNRLYRIGHSTWGGSEVTIPDRWVDLVPTPGPDIPAAPVAS